MSTYAASLTGGTALAKLTLVPSSTYQVRIARIEASGVLTANGGSMSYTVAVYPSTTPTGGSALTPVMPMQSGAPAALATVKSGATISGSFCSLHQETVTSAFDSSGAAFAANAPMNSTYNFALDLILSSGSTLYVASSTSGATSASLTMVVYFEEIRTPRTL